MICDFCHRDFHQLAKDAVCIRPFLRVLTRPSCCLAAGCPFAPEEDPSAHAKRFLVRDALAQNALRPLCEECAENFARFGNPKPSVSIASVPPPPSLFVPLPILQLVPVCDAPPSSRAVSFPPAPSDTRSPRSNGSQNGCRMGLWLFGVVGWPWIGASTVPSLRPSSGPSAAFACEKRNGPLRLSHLHPPC